MNNVHKKYHDVVVKFQAVFGKGWLAGGAVRDTLFNRPVKDLDFCTTKTITVERLKEVWPDRKFVKLSREGGGEDDNYDNEVIVGIWGTEEGDINVMQVYDMAEYVDSFPDNLSAVWYNGAFVDWRFDWLKVVSEGVVTCKHDIQEKRLKKLQAKYPDMVYEIEEAPEEKTEQLVWGFPVEAERG